MPFFYNAADIVVLPYRKIYQSGVLLMAMSYQKPVIVSDLEGMIEIIQDNKNGYVFETGNCKSLSKKIINALDDPIRLEAIGSAGFKTVVEKHCWNLIGNKTVQLYKSI